MTTLLETAAARLVPPSATWAVERHLDTDVHVVRDGAVDGLPPVVLLHHWFGTAHTWRYVIAALSPSTAVIAHDRPGFGFSHRGDGAGPDRARRYTRAHAADLLASILDVDGHDRAVLVGVSAGATATLEFLDRHPDRVAGAVFVAPAVTGDLGTPRWTRGLLRRGVGATAAARFIRRRRGTIDHARVGNSWADPSRVSDDDVAAYDLAMSGPGWAEALWARMVADPPPDLRHVFARIRVPTLFVNGLADPVIRPTWTTEAADATPGGTFSPLPGVGHTPHEEAPTQLVPLVRELLRRAT